MTQPILTEHEVLAMDKLQLIEAHIDILTGSEDPESVRTSAVALLNTQAGRDYVTANPMAL
jgi:hypothetical protein